MMSEQSLKLAEQVSPHQHKLPDCLCSYSTAAVSLRVVFVDAKTLLMNDASHEKFVLIEYFCSYLLSVPVLLLISLHYGTKIMPFVLEFKINVIIVTLPHPSPKSVPTSLHQ
jgi:hypothetical protein